jgi:small subunit ribosomal protein S14
MKFLLGRERLRREQFRKIETQIIALKFIIHNQNLSATFRWEAFLKLSKITKKNSRVCLKNRCSATGRGRGFLRFFSLSRIAVRDFARNNELPFITKDSW